MRDISVLLAEAYCIFLWLFLLMLDFRFLSTIQDAKMILMAPLPDNWKRPPGCPHTGCLTLEILKIFWNYFSSWKSWKSAGNLQSLLEIFWFSLRVCAFVFNISYNYLYFRVYRYKISRGKPGSIDIEVSNFNKCPLTHLLIGW